jgi:hypothetical protein
MGGNVVVWNVYKVIAVILVQFGSDWSNIERVRGICIKKLKFLIFFFEKFVLGGLACAQGCRELWVLIYRYNLINTER